MSSARLVALSFALAVALLALPLSAHAGLYAGVEDALLSREVAFEQDRQLSASCPGGFRVGAAAVDITPGVKRPDGTYELWSEAYVDLNGNGVYDAPDPIGGDLEGDPFVDENANGKWDGPFMAGYGHKKTPGGYYVATAVHDPVWARAVALTCGDVTLGLVSVDTVGLFRDFVNLVRAEAPADYAHVVVASTHTHDSVDTMGLWGPTILIDGKDPRTMAHYKSGILQALEDAFDAREDVASVRVGSGLTRALIPTTGPVQTDLRDPFVIDDRVLAAQFLDGSGATIATIVNWSPHPETLAGTVGEISSDYAHWLRLAIEKDGATVGGVTKAPVGGTTVFFSGAVGGMMTTLGAKPRDEAGVEIRDHSYEKAARIGEVAAWVALDALQKGTTASVDGVDLGVRLATVPADNAFLLALNTIGVFDHGVAVGPAEVGAVGEPGVVAPFPFFRTEVNVVTLRAGGSPLLQALTVPGELLPEVALGNTLSADPEATFPKCFAHSPEKQMFNGAREGKPNPATGLREAGFERKLASKPAYPPEPAVVQLAKAPYVMLFGLANDELGYIVPANDYEMATMFPEVYSDGRDRCGDADHYEETNSASSLLAPAVANALASLLDPTFVPRPLPKEQVGFDDETATLWVDTSRSGGFEREEDTRVSAGVPEGLPSCWGFVNGHGQDEGRTPTKETHGIWIDLNGDCALTTGDAVLFEDFWAQSEGQPRYRP